jgi:hydrogenase maturation protease
VLKNLAGRPVVLTNRMASWVKMTQNMKTIIVGLGNPILGDDGVGWKVAQEVKQHLGEDSTVDVECYSLSGLSLMEQLIGYERVVLIDSLNTGRHEQGEVVTFTLDTLEDLTYGHSASAHDASLKTALEVGRSMGEKLPAEKDIHIIAIEARHVYDFSEELSPEVAVSVPVAVQKVLDLLAA